MPRIIFKSVGNTDPLPSHEQSILNNLVFVKLCDCEIFSLLQNIDKPQREAALQEALRWSFVHDLVADDE